MARPLELLGGKVTLRAEPFFWFAMALFGASLGRGSARESFAWGAVIGLSVLLHELGHAAVCLLCGSGADIALQGFGGSTRARDLDRIGTWWRRAALDLAGCAAGFAAAAAAAGVLYAGASPEARRLASMFFAVNLWFSIFNLLPVSPMDGGKLVAGLLSARWGERGRRAAHGFGALAGAAAALYFYRVEAFFGALLCGAMAAGEVRALKRSLAMTPADSDPAITAELPRAVALWEAGRRAEAIAALTALREKAKAGLTFEAATLQLAVFLYVSGEAEKSYPLFKSVDESEMPPAAKHAYADAALRREDFETALRLGRMNFHDAPGADTALAAAIAAAGLRDARETASWLKTALRHGLDRARLRAREFDPVRGSEEFQDLLDGPR